MLGRSELARREGYERPVAYSSVALSVIGLLSGGAADGHRLGCDVPDRWLPPMPWWPIVRGGGGRLILIHPAVSRRVLGLVGRVLGRTLEVDMPNWTSCLRLAVSYVPVWVLDCRGHLTGHRIPGSPPAHRAGRLRRRRELDHRVHHSCARRDRRPRSSLRGCGGSGCGTCSRGRPPCPGTLCGGGRPGRESAGWSFG